MTEEIFKAIDELIAEMKNKHNVKGTSSCYSASYSYTKENGKKPKVVYDIKYQDSTGKKIHKTNIPQIENKKHNCGCLDFNTQRQNINIVKQAIMVADSIKDLNIEEYLTRNKSSGNIYFENGYWINMDKIHNKERFRQLIAKAINKGTLKMQNKKEG